jgi:hypothetical protein
VGCVCSVDVSNAYTAFIFKTGEYAKQALCSRRIRWVGNVVYVGEKRNVYEVVVGKPEEQRPIGKV